MSTVKTNNWPFNFEAICHCDRFRVLDLIRSETIKRKQQNVCPIKLDELSRILKIEPTIIQGHLSTLIRRGYVKRLGAGRGCSYYAT